MPEDLPTLWDIVAGLANDQKRLWELVLDTRKATLSNVDVLPENQKRLIAVSAMGIALAKMDEMTHRLEVKFDHVNARLDRLLFYAEGGEPDGIQYRCDWCKRVCDPYANDCILIIPENAEPPILCPLSKENRKVKWQRVE